MEEGEETKDSRTEKEDVEKVSDNHQDVFPDQTKLKIIDQEKLLSIKEKFEVNLVCSKKALTFSFSLPVFQ